MGKPTLDQCEGSINHFSHQHPLQLYNHSTLQIPTRVACSGCHDEASGSMYHCSICNYFLHKKCSEMPQKITHPFDQEHVLCLLEKPIYPEGIFNCDACGQKGGGFSYHCETCGTDLHILCASLPIHFNHHCHVHQLTLSFAPAYPKKSFHCGICQSLGSNIWFYRCSSCEFDVHLSCVSALRKSQVQHPTSSMTNYGNNFQNPMPQQIGQFSTGQPQNQAQVMGMPYTSSMPQMMSPTLPQKNFMMNPTTSNPAIGGAFNPMVQQQQQQQQMVQQAFAQQQQAIAKQHAMIQQQVMAQKQAIMPQQMMPVMPQQPMMMNNPMVAQQQQLMAQQQLIAQQQLMAQQQGGNMLMNSLVNGMASGISSAATDAILQGIMGGGGGNGMMTDSSGFGAMDGSGGGEYTN